MKGQTGQIALIVLLVIAGALTVGVAVSKRVVVETKIDKDEELMKEAFNAAESGIDTYLGTGKSDPYISSRGSGLRADLKVSQIGNNASMLYFNDAVAANRPETYWLAEHDTNGNVDYTRYYQGSEVSLCISESFTGSVKVAYFYIEADRLVRVQRWIYNSSSNQIQNGISFDPDLMAEEGCPSGQQKVARIPITEMPVLIVVNPLGDSARMALLSDDNGAVFPSQGELITATGTAGVVNSQAGAKVTVKRERRWNAGLLNYMLEPLQSKTGILD